MAASGGTRASARSGRRMAVAAAGAALGHAVLIGVAALVLDCRPARERAAPPAASPADLGPISFVTLLDPAPATELIVPLPGAGDDGAFDGTHPAPGAEVDLPGQRAARVGGGAAGGVESWTARRDRGDMRALSWNDPDRYRATHVPAGTRRQSPEALARAARTGWDDRADPRPAIRDGLDQAERAGIPLAEERDWQDADPLFDGNSDRTRAARVAGTTATRAHRAFVDEGPAAADVIARGAHADDLSAAGASNQRRPDAFDYASPRAGGTADGVAGPRPAPGVSAVGRGRGEAASRADVTEGSGRLSVLARRQDPYFRHMYRRIDELIEFPKELAYSLDQGEVVVVFSLRADGSVSELEVSIPSGFDAFDLQVARAVVRAGPYGSVPRALRSRHDTITVRLPYAFKNRMIR